VAASRGCIPTKPTRSPASGQAVEAERFGGFEVDDQLEFRGLLDRHIRWLLALQNLDHKRGRPPKRVGTIGAVGH
jgi:hypothetical protein